MNLNRIAVKTRLGGPSGKNAHQAGPSNHQQATGENLMVGKKFRLGALVAGLEPALAYWDGRDTRTPGPAPEAREAADFAVDAIDEMLAELHQVRARLVSEIRQAEDAFMAHLDAKYGPLANTPATSTEVA